MSHVLLAIPGSISEEREVQRDADELYEIVDGVEVALPPMSVESNVIGARLGFAIRLFTYPMNLGEIYSHLLVRLNLSDGRERSRRPDFIYVPYTKWPKRRKLVRDAAWNIVPDIAVEVISPTDPFSEVYKKVGEYFESGIPQVWIVDPGSETVWVLNSRYKQRVLGL